MADYDPEEIEFDSGELDRAHSALKMRAGQLRAGMERLTQSLKPMRETWGASPSKAGHDTVVAEGKLRAAIEDMCGLIDRFSGEVSDGSGQQVALDNNLATLVG